MVLFVDVFCSTRVYLIEPNEELKVRGMSFRSDTIVFCCLFNDSFPMVNENDGLFIIPYLFHAKYIKNKLRKKTQSYKTNTNGKKSKIITNETNITIK